MANLLLEVDYGCIVCCDGKKKIFPSMARKIVDTTGAGDCWDAGFIALVCQTGSPWKMWRGQAPLPLLSAWNKSAAAPAFQSGTKFSLWQARCLNNVL